MKSSSQPRKLVPINHKPSNNIATQNPFLEALSIKQVFSPRNTRNQPQASNPQSNTVTSNQEEAKLEQSGDQIIFIPRESTNHSQNVVLAMTNGNRLKRSSALIGCPGCDEFINPSLQDEHYKSCRQMSKCRSCKSFYPILLEERHQTDCKQSELDYDDSDSPILLSCDICQERVESVFFDDHLMNCIESSVQPRNQPGTPRFRSPARDVFPPSNLPRPTKKTKNFTDSKKPAVDEVQIPCEFCQTLVGILVLNNHQSSCSQNPDRNNNSTTSPERNDDSGRREIGLYDSSMNILVDEIDFMYSRRVSRLPVRKQSNKENKGQTDPVVTKFKLGHGLNKDDPAHCTCVICQVDYEEGDEIGTLLCFHKYHKKCIDDWFKQKRECPVCKSTQ